MVEKKKIAFFPLLSFFFKLIECVEKVLSKTFNMLHILCLAA